MEKLFQGGLVGIMRNGVDSVPHDLDDLRSYLEGLQAMLAEMAVEADPSWRPPQEAAAECETLLELEQSIARKAADVRADSIDKVLKKLAIWDLIADEPDEPAVDHLLVRSAAADLRRLDRSGASA